MNNFRRGVSTWNLKRRNQWKYQWKYQYMSHYTCQSVISVHKSNYFILLIFRQFIFQHIIIRNPSLTMFIE